MMVPKWCIFGDFWGPVFPASHVQHISDLHSKFALRPQHVWKYGRHPISDRWDETRKKRRRKKKIEITRQKYNVRTYYITTLSVCVHILTSTSESRLTFNLGK